MLVRRFARPAQRKHAPPFAWPFVASVLLSFTASCGGADDGPELPPTAVLGSGENSFAPIADGGIARVIRGPQGGYHLIGSVRVTGIVPGDPDDLASSDNPNTVFSVWSGNQRIDQSGANFTQGLDPIGGGTFEMVGRIVILNIQTDADIDGQTLRFVVEVTDVDGVVVSDERNVVIEPDPRN